MKFKMTNEPMSMFSYSSLTDIVMLLLIFFLLTSQFVVQTGVKVKLPGSKTNEQSAPSRMVVAITSAGLIYAGDKQVGIEQLSSELEKMKAADPDRNLIIRADKTVIIDLVIKVIDAAKGVGIEKFTLQTEKEQI